MNPGYSQCKYVEGAPPTPPPIPPTSFPTPSPPPPTLPPQPAPTRPPVLSEGCYSKNYKNCIPEGYSSDEDSCDMVWLPNGEESNCIGLWEECTSQANSC